MKLNYHFFHSRGIELNCDHDLFLDGNRNNQMGFFGETNSNFRNTERDSELIAFMISEHREIPFEV
jgi:hypothetical protein